MKDNSIQENSTKIFELESDQLALVSAGATGIPQTWPPDPDYP